MLTDLVQIRIMGEKKRDENERFRRFIKSRSHSDRKLRQIAEVIQEQIDCRQCANCCKLASTSVSERDIERMARYLRIPPDQFVAQYTDGEDEDGLILRRRLGGECVFLSGNDCTVYEARPEICERFPHLVRGNGSIASRMWSFIDRAVYCPIVYNSLQAFKAELRFRK